MGPAVAKAMTMMAIALPTMFAVIGIFYVATKMLHKALPAEVEEEEGEEEDED